MGLPPSVGLTLASPTATTEQLELLVTDALFKLATIHRADLAGMRTERKSAAENTNTARMTQYPLPVIALNAARDTGNLKTLGLSVSITLPLWNRGRGDLAIAQATEEQADAAYSARLLNIYADLDAAYSALLLVNKQARDATEIALQMDALVSGTLAAVARGDYAASQSNELRIASINKHIQAIELAMKQAELLIALELNLGVPLENIK
jgi:outer membrane protein TolC